MKKKIVITGGTGFIGRSLSRELSLSGYSVYVLTRNSTKAQQIFGNTATAVAWDAKSSEGWLDIAEGATAIINLAGENVASGRWTKKKKSDIIQSRVHSVQAVIDAIKKCTNKPEALIQASAAGFYGMTLEKTEFDEQSPPGRGFLAEVTQQWEQASEEAESLGTRRVLIRTGLVLGPGGGALEKLVLPYKFFMGGYLGTGRQYMSWIHIKDETKAIIFLIENKELHGPFNLTAPTPATAQEFSNSLAKALKRPSWFNIPSFVISLLFGEMGKEALLLGQRILPQGLLHAGFKFQFTTVEEALGDLVA